MSLVTVKSKFQVVIPQSVRDQIGVTVGDVLEAKAEGGRIVFMPKALIDRDQQTSAQRRRIATELATSLAEHKEGKSAGPFDHQEMVNYLHSRTGGARKNAKKRS